MFWWPILLLALAAQEQPVIRVNVDLVQFDVVVTDAHGNPVPGLHREDFTVLEAGKPQSLTHLTYVPGSRIESTAKTRAVVAIPSSEPPRPEQIARTVVILADDFGLSEQTYAAVHAALETFVERQFQPGDLAAIVTSSGRLGALERLTTDRRLLRAAVAKFTSIPNHRESVLDPESSFGCLKSGDPTTYYSRLSIAAFRRVAESLRPMPGRRSIVLFSEGLPLVRDATPKKSGRSSGKHCEMGSDVLDQLLIDDFEAFLDDVNRSGVTVNTIDPRGLIANFDTAEVSQFGAGSVDERLQEFRSRQGTLDEIARRTGGTAIVNDNDLSGAVARLLNADAGYYLLGYRPDGQARHGVRNPKVSVNRPGIKVRFHTSLYEDKPEPLRDAATQLASAARSPFARADLHIQLVSRFWDSGKQTGTVLDTSLRIDAHDLEFRSENGRRLATFDLVAVVFGLERKPLNTFEKRYTVSLTEDAWKRALSEGLVQRLQMRLPRPGVYQLRGAVHDVSTGRIGSAGEFVEVPDLRRGAMALSGIVLSRAGTEAMVFHRGDSVSYVVQVLNAPAGPLSVKAALLKDGKVLGTSAAARIDNSDPKRPVAADIFRLGSQLVPGDYLLSVSATASTGATAMRTVELEVLNN